MGVIKKKITLYSTSIPIRSLIRKAFKGYQYEVLEIAGSSKAPCVGANEQQQDAYMRLTLPEKVDFVVTTAGLTKLVESLTASLALKQGRNDVYTLVLPEAMEYLRDKLDQRGELVLVGGDQAK